MTKRDRQIRNVVAVTLGLLGYSKAQIARQCKLTPRAVLFILEAQFSRCWHCYRVAFSEDRKCDLCAATAKLGNFPCVMNGYYRQSALKRRLNDRFVIALMEKESAYTRRESLGFRYTH